MPISKPLTKFAAEKIAAGPWQSNLEILHSNHYNNYTEDL